MFGLDPLVRMGPGAGFSEHDEEMRLHRRAKYCLKNYMTIALTRRSLHHAVNQLVTELTRPISTSCDIFFF